MIYKKCAVCGARFGVGAETCSACRGPLITVEEADASDAAEAEPRSSILWVVLLWVLELAPGLASPKVLVMGVLAVAVAAALAGLATFMFVLGAVVTAMCIGVFALVSYWTALTWLLSGYVCVPAEGMCDFRTGQWLAFILLGVGPIAVCIGLIGAATPA